MRIEREPPDFCSPHGVLVSVEVRLRAGPGACFRGGRSMTGLVETFVMPDASKLIIPALPTSIAVS